MGSWKSLVISTILILGARARARVLIPVEGHIQKKSAGDFRPLSTPVVKKHPAVKTAKVGKTAKTKNTSALVKPTIPIASKQSELTLKWAVSIAESHNPRIRELQASVDMASWEKTKVLAAQIPHVELLGSHYLDEKWAMIPVDFQGAHILFPEQLPYSTFGIRAEWNVFDGFMTYHGYQSAEDNYRASRHELARAEFGLREEVRTEFYKALGAKVLLDVAKQNIATLERHLADVTRRIHGGYSTNFDALRISVQLDEAQSEKMSAEDQVQINNIKLAQTLGLPSLTGKLVGTLPVPSEADIPANLQAAPQNRDDLQALAERERGARAQAGASRASWWPQVGLYAERDWNDYVNQSLFGGQTDYGNSYGIGVNFHWDLFDGGASTASEHIAADERLQAAERRQNLENDIPGQIEIWHRRFLQSVALYSARVASIKKAMESVRLARIGVEAGTQTNTDYLDAELDLIRSRAEAVRAQIEAIAALGQLHLALGR